jgi:hypothetical protein
MRLYALAKFLLGSNRALPHRGESAIRSRTASGIRDEPDWRGMLRVEEARVLSHLDTAFGLRSLRIAVPEVPEEPLF